MTTTPPSPSGPATVTLTALDGLPLTTETVRDTVAAAARAIAERNGVELLALKTFPDRITATLDGSNLVAIGFAAELRRITNAWHRGKFNADLWGEPLDHDDDTYGLFGHNGD